MQTLVILVNDRVMDVITCKKEQNIHEMLCAYMQKEICDVQNTEIISLTEVKIISKLNTTFMVKVKKVRECLEYTGGKFY